MTATSVDGGCDVGVADEVDALLQKQGGGRVPDAEKSCAVEESHDAVPDVSPSEKLETALAESKKRRQQRP
ncbi:hypothetical protein ACWEF9_11635 [Streptomyces sp. NPDC004980]